MALFGGGALVIWRDVRDETDYNEWHSKEHMLAGLHQLLHAITEPDLGRASG